MDADRLKLYLDRNPFSKLSDVVRDLLYDRIITLNLLPSAKINVKQIATELGISPSPVIAALNKLQLIGFVETRDGTTGYFVSELNMKDMVNLYNARAAIESEAAFRCAKNMDAPTIETLEGMAAKFEKAMLAKDSFLVRELDLPFHNLIIKSCGNKYLQQSYDSILPRLIRYQRYCSSFINSEANTPWSEEISHHHSAVVSAIKMHLPDMARQCMYEHIDLCIYHAAFSLERVDIFNV